MALQIASDKSCHASAVYEDRVLPQYPLKLQIGVAKQAVSPGGGVLLSHGGRVCENAEKEENIAMIEAIQNAEICFIFFSLRLQLTGSKFRTKK